MTLRDRIEAGEFGGNLQLPLRPYRPGHFQDCHARQMENYHAALRQYEVESRALDEVFDRAMCEECGLCYDEPFVKAMLRVARGEEVVRGLEGVLDVFLSLLPLWLEARKMARPS